jgi:hypothetical protein
MKLPKISSEAFALIIIGYIILIGCALAYYSSRPEPLGAYITQRNCQFIEFADLHAAACRDGSTWLVSPLNP